MKTLGRQHRMVAVGLAAMAGMVDAIGFMASGGYFLSFMSGNSTRLSVGIADGSPIMLVLLLILGFLLGVTGGSLFMRGGVPPEKARQPGLLLFIAAILTVAPFVAQAGAMTLALFLSAMCMGAENTLFEREGEVSFGLTYMTGALVKIGQCLASMLRGGQRLAWAPYAMLWAGLVGGAVIGATLFSSEGIYALWLPALLALGFAGTTYRIAKVEQHQNTSRLH